MEGRLLEGFVLIEAHRQLEGLAAHAKLLAALPPLGDLALLPAADEPPEHNYQERSMHCLKPFLKDESGQDLIEYALVAGVVALGAILCLQGFSNTTALGLGTIGNSLANATS